MNGPTYQNAIAKAWQIVWRNKALWILGLLSAVLGQFGIGDFFGRLWLLYDEQALIGDWLYSWKLSLNYSAWSWQNTVGMVWLAGLLLCLLIAFIFLAVVSQGALIAYSTSAFTTKRFAHLGRAWYRGVRHFWRLLAVNLFYRALLLLLLLAGAWFLEIYLFYRSVWIGVLLLLVLAVIMFYYLVFSTVYIYSAGYIVADNNTLWRSVRNGYRLFMRHILVSFEAGLCLLLFNLALLLILVASIPFAFMPSVAILAAAWLFSTGWLVVVAICVGIFLWILIAACLVAIFNAFATSAWMYLFVKMHKEGIISRIMRLAGKLFRKL